MRPDDLHDPRMTRQEAELQEFLDKRLSYEETPDLIKITPRGGYLLVGLCAEGSRMDVTFKLLQAIGEFFQTDRVNVVKDSHVTSYGSCETCDYGLEDSVEFEVYV
jgi:hypothetical protein